MLGSARPVPRSRRSTQGGRETEPWSAAAAAAPGSDGAACPISARVGSLEQALRLIQFGTGRVRGGRRYSHYRCFTGGPGMTIAMDTSAPEEGSAAAEAPAGIAR